MESIQQSSTTADELGVSSNERNLCSSKDVTPFVCTLCEKTVSRKDALKRHMLFHSKERPFTCDVCKASFVQKSDLKRHELYHLKVPVQYNCNQCDQTFLKKRDLLKHRKIHKISKQYNCVQCEALFPTKVGLIQHTKVHKPVKQYKCSECDEIFPLKHNVLKHEILKHGKTHKAVKHFKCYQCDQLFFKKWDLRKHKKTHTLPQQNQCYHCDLVFKDGEELKKHLRSEYLLPPHDPAEKEELWEKVKHFPRSNALNTFTTVFIHPNAGNEHDFSIFFDSIKPDVLNELKYQIQEKMSIKWHAIVHPILKKDDAGETETITPHFWSDTVSEFSYLYLSNHIDQAFNKMITSFENFNEQGSNWKLDKILSLELKIAQLLYFPSKDSVENV